MLCALFSCSKETAVQPQSSLVGKWSNSAVFEASSNNGWQLVTTASPETFTFHPDSQFELFLDVQAGKGKYSYDASVATLSLSYDRSPNGTPARVITRKVELCTQDRIILVVETNGVAVYKSEYRRVD